MQTNKYFLVCMAIFFSILNTNAQAPYFVTRTSEVLDVDCTPLSSVGLCNLLRNINFTPLPTYDPVSNMSDPFGLGYIPDWYPAQESANITDLGAEGFGIPNPTPPFPAMGFAFMAAGRDINNNLRTEGIAQKIAPLTATQKYCLSFFMKRGYAFELPASPIALKIVLMNCSDYSAVVSSGPMPPPPVNSKVIYCNLPISIYPDWEQKIVTFIPDRNYDMIWIYPDVDYRPLDEGPTLAFAYPELISIQNFSAGLPPTPTNPGCYVTIGPNVPNCSVTNAVFKWTGPAGQIITPSATQQISIDASIAANRGTWTLSMNPPASVNNNGNTCSQLLTISATVVVPNNCTTPCIILPGM